MSEQDWRLQGQETYLRGLAWKYSNWRLTREGWDHDHCELCWAEISDDASGHADYNAAWTTADEYRWVCPVCFADFRDRFDWVVDAASA